MSAQATENADTVRSLILAAFAGPRSEWRTVGGISRQTGLPASVITEFVTAHPELFVESPITIGGIKAFGFRERVDVSD